ncbi:Bro-N domain-containing protein [Candidatus Microgenomates bacterium]|nr:Bro-N domain-containing protein [Candidatus Microgenomates bacterium]
MDKKGLILFQEKQIRRVWHQKEWWFSVVDVVEALTESVDSKDYWFKMKIRVKGSDGVELSTICRQLKLKALDGKLRMTDCSNTGGLLRIIQSIPSPKAEPFKLWLAQVGKERLEEIENPELAQERMKKIYELKGYSKGWIEKRLRGIAIRQDLTDEWRQRGVKQQSDYAILTAEISKATFGMTPGQYKKYKKIPGKSKINLRDNMTDLELIFTMLGERVTIEISKKEKPRSFTSNKLVANRGGSVAGYAREETEKEIGNSVITKKNYLPKRKPINKLK